MFRSRIAKLTVAGFAAAAGLILLVSSVGAHQGRLLAREGMTLSSSTASSARQREIDAAADAAAVAAEAQKEAAAKAAEAAKEKAAAAAEQATEAQDETGDVETETGDNETETDTNDTTQTAGTHNDSGDNKGESHSGD